MIVMKLSLSGNLSNLRSQSTRRKRVIERAPSVGPGQEKRRVPRRELPSYGRQKRPSPSRIEVTGNPGMVIARQGAERSFV